MQKFENMDVIAALEAIMHQNTAYYQSDFAYDIKMLREAARSDQPEDKLLLWLSRPSGTFCFRERDVLLKDTQAYNTWKFCGEQTHDRILAYAVELTGAANGTVQGNLYELDYQQHFQHIRDAALPVGTNRLIYESGMREIGPKEHFDSRPDKYFGEFVRYEMQPRDPELLQAVIRQEQRSREPARPGDFKEHLAALHTGLIECITLSDTGSAVTLVCNDEGKLLGLPLNRPLWDGADVLAGISGRMRQRRESDFPAAECNGFLQREIQSFYH